MSEQWRGEPLSVGVPTEPHEFYRLLPTKDATRDAFRPDSEVRTRFWTENWCTYRGFSAWETLEAAREQAHDLNRVRQERGEEPLFTHVVRFRLWPKRRHAIADLPPLDGHVAVWAGADELRIDEPESIQEGEAMYDG